MIYMSPPLQERLLPVFHFALNPGGFLVLGLAETVGSFGDLFELTSSVHKIYRRRETDQPAAAHLHGRRLARRHGREAAGHRESAAGRLPARGRPPGPEPLRARPACS